MPAACARGGQAGQRRGTVPDRSMRSGGGVSLVTLSSHDLLWVT
jgi:hypothetical protein